MTALMYLLIGLAAVGAAYALVRKPIREYFRMRGDRVVACPENQQTVAVRVDARHAALYVVGGPRAPAPGVVHAVAREGGVRPGLPEADRSPADGLPGRGRRSSGWYADKACAICGKALGPIDWAEHKPALRAPDGAHPGMERRGARDALRRDGDPRRDLLGLPRRRDVPAGAPGSGHRQSPREPAEALARAGAPAVRPGPPPL